MTKLPLSVIIPVTHDELILLSSEILKKNNSLGDESPLLILNMSKMEALTSLVNEKNSEAHLLNIDKIVAIEKRDALLGSGMSPKTILYYILACRNVLKGYFKDEVKKMGDYGFAVKNERGTVAIPAKVTEILELAGKIISKHLEEGESSPLRGLNMSDFNIKYTQAMSDHQRAMKAINDKKIAIEERDRACGLANIYRRNNSGTLLSYVRQVRFILMGFYKGDEVELHEWGFNVLFSKQVPKGRKSLTGKVCDNQGKALSAVQVTIVELDVMVKTNSSGIYKFIRQPAGTYSIQFSKANYPNHLIGGIVITDDECTELDMEL